MSNDDEAIAREAYLRWCASGCPGLTADTLVNDVVDVAKIAVGLTRKGWKPPPPEVLAFREWALRRYVGQSYPIAKGEWDQCDAAVAFAAGVKWSSDRDRKHISTLVDALEEYGNSEWYMDEIEEVLAPFKETDR